MRYRLHWGPLNQLLQESGWKDTVVALPGEQHVGEKGRVYGMVTRIIMRFDLPGDYVWHSHMLSHGDNEVMRPLVVSPSPSYKGECPVECLKKTLSQADKGHDAAFDALSDRASADEAVACHHHTLALAYARHWCSNAWRRNTHRVFVNEVRIVGS